MQIKIKLKEKQWTKKNKELESQIAALKKEKDVLFKENETLKKQNEDDQKALADALVNQALNDGKIANSQKEWAMTYACKDLQGFKDFLQSSNSKQVPQNNMFANKNTASNTNNADVVKLMLGE